LSFAHRQVVLRDEHSGKDSRSLCAYLDEAGSLHIDGQDLGPSTSPVSGDGEYEWYYTIGVEHLPRLVVLLGGSQDDDLLDLLEERWSGARSGDLEPLLRTSGIPVTFFSYSG
jgi:hypothetical protein